MKKRTISRRQWLAQSSASLAAAGTLGWAGQSSYGSPDLASRKPRAKVERLGVGVIGLRYQGSVIAEKARLFADIVAIADVDRHVREQARASFGSTPRIFEQYREMLARPEVDVVLIATPDHWHTQMLIDAVRAKKDVYCEKPLTLTIDEGKLIRSVVKASDQVVQVGTWQRSDARFRMAAEMVRQQRIGRLRKVSCVTDKNPVGGPFKPVPVPKHFNWDLWQGQAPKVPYLAERAHYTFRWWYEYSGGKMTDWGAHHIDIAQWAIGGLPVRVDGRGKHPNVRDGYNVATDFSATIGYDNGVALEIKDEGRRGILFEGDEGRLFVNRGILAGKPVDALGEHPLPRGEFQLYDFDNLERTERVGKLDAIINHMGNFFDCIEERRQPISDIESQHRSVSTCHLANLSLRLGRPLKWDPERESFVNDSEADSFLRREQRAGFEIV